MDNITSHKTPILVSIIIATYNAAERLPYCLQSIRDLASDQVEVVIVDGGSTDDTVDIARNFPYPYLTVISGPDQGIYDAYNKGTRLASGRWFHFLGADDLVLEGFAEMMKLLKDESTIYYGDSEAYYLGEGRPDYILLGGRFTKYRLAKYPVNHQAVLYPAKVFGIFSYDLRYRIFADYAMNLKLWGHPDFRTVYHPLFIVKYNMNGFSSRVQDIVFRNEKPALIKQHLGWFIYWRFKWKKYRKKLEGNTNW